MGQILIRRLDDVAIERQKLHARQRRTSVEAVAREAIQHAASELGFDEKMGLA